MNITAISNFLMSNIYLYICILIVLIILVTILCIFISNKKNRNKIKKDYIEAEKVEAELEKNDGMPTELEEILKKMQENVDVKPEEVVKQFEEEQEEKAIISYKELVDNVKAGKIEVIDDEQGDINYVDKLDLGEPVEPLEFIDDGSDITPEMVREAIEEISSSSYKEEPKKFKNSEFISPIYGVMEDNLDYPKVKKMDNILNLMSTKDYTELTDEIKRQEEFLEALKAFRNNL